MRRVTIAPVTRVEGRAEVEIILDDAGEVSEAFFVVPELRGFEKLCIGRPVEELPAFTSRICGLCPEAHHMASVKALDRLFGVEPPPAVRAIRELLYSAFVLANHAIHFFALAGPDLLLGPETERGQRSLFGVLRDLGPELARMVVKSRVANHEVIEMLGGRRIQPVAGLPGGWTRAVSEMMRERILEVAHANVAFALRCLDVFREAVLGNRELAPLLTDPTYTQPTYSMGTVGPDSQLELFDGDHRVVTPGGGELLRFAAADYREAIAEEVAPWSYVKLPYLRGVGWRGLRAGEESGVFAVGPLARLNTCDGVPTPLAQQAYVELYSSFSERTSDGRFAPIHNRLQNHAARLVELLYAAERMEELASLPELTDPEVRALVPAAPVRRQAVGSVEAPRGTLFHDYRVDERGIVTEVDLIVATTCNNAAISLSVASAARAMDRAGGAVGDRLLNQVEMAIRAHDPCLACASHSFPGGMSLAITLRDRDGGVVATLRR